MIETCISNIMNGMGQYVKKVYGTREVIKVTKYNQPVIAIMDWQEYQRLLALEASAEAKQEEKPMGDEEIKKAVEAARLREADRAAGITRRTYVDWSEPDRALITLYDAVKEFKDIVNQDTFIAEYDDGDGMLPMKGSVETIGGRVKLLLVLPGKIFTATMTALAAKRIGKDLLDAAKRAEGELNDA